MGGVARAVVVLLALAACDAPAIPAVEPTDARTVEPAASPAAPAAPSASSALASCGRTPKRTNSLLLRCPGGVQIEVIEFSAGERADDPLEFAADMMGKGSAAEGKSIVRAKVRFRAGTVDAVLIAPSADHAMAEVVVQALRLPEGLLVLAVCAQGEGKEVGVEKCATLMGDAQAHGLPGGAFAESPTTLVFDTKTLTVPPGCKRVPGNKISCPGEGLLWFSVLSSEAGRTTREILDLIQEGEAPGIGVVSTPCTLLGEPAECHVMLLDDPPETKRKLVAIRATASGIAVASCITREKAKSLTPRPCDQVLAIPSKN